ncbi:uncharacterized protein TNCV_2503431 [Trichonephila clavipes]|nr:uncharacterized protein TNCV_2503431 [Trichonephila clavipes]
MWQQVLATDTLSSYIHDYPTLPADVAEAIYPIYKDLRNVKFLEKCVGGFTQNNNESIAAHAHIDKEDAQRVIISDAREHGSTRKGGMARRQHQLDLLEATDTVEGPSKGPEIDDTM